MDKLKKVVSNVCYFMGTMLALDNLNRFSFVEKISDIDSGSFLDVTGSVSYTVFGAMIAITIGFKLLLNTRDYAIGNARRCGALNPFC
jgi:hypothetical protein